MPGPSAPSTRAIRCGPKRVLQFRVGGAVEPDPPEARLGDFLQRSGEVDDADPRHALQRARRGLGQRAAFARRMAILGDDADRPERRGGAEDRADIMRVGDLVEHQQGGAFGRVGEDVAEPDVLERRNLDHHALVRRVVGHQPAEIGDVGEAQRGCGIEGEFGRGVVGDPYARDPPLGIGERRGDRVPPPESRPPAAAPVASASLMLCHGAPMRR